MIPSDDTRSPDASTRVLCVDDNTDMTSVMRMMIDAQPEMECIGCLASADHLIEEVRGLRPPPDVLLLDATMPGTDPLAAMSNLTAEFPDLRTVILSGHDDDAFVHRVMNAGAWGCVSKRDEPDTIMQAIREVAAGNAWWPRTP